MTKFGDRRKGPIGPKRAVKFRGPSGQQSNGTAKPPRWIVELEAAGRSREEFRVALPSTTSKNRDG